MLVALRPASATQLFDQRRTLVSPVASLGRSIATGPKLPNRLHVKNNRGREALKKKHLKSPRTPSVFMAVFNFTLRYKKYIHVEVVFETS